MRKKKTRTQFFVQKRGMKYHSLIEKRKDSFIFSMGRKKEYIFSPKKEEQPTASNLRSNDDFITALHRAALVSRFPDSSSGKCRQTPEGETVVCRDSHVHRSRSRFNFHHYPLCENPWKGTLDFKSHSS